MGAGWKRFMDGYVRFAEGKGFAVLAALCVAVITGTAVWTGRSAEEPPSPTPPAAEEQYAASLYQQSLSSASSPSPLPTQQPIRWQSPLQEVVVLRGFAADAMLRSGVTGVWASHPAVDLQADAGEPVCAMADGTVDACGKDGLNGSWVVIRHSGEHTTRYAGLALLAAIRTGDPVKAGQTIGFAGNDMIDETDLGPHLHLQAFRSGEPIDPLQLIK